MAKSAAGNAIISVYDKNGIAEFAAGLVKLGWHVYASGGTAKEISSAGIEVTDVADLVGGDAILGHRVVTLSRELYAGILADASKQEDMEELKRLNIPLIDLVCVDMYPLEETIANKNSTTSDVIQQTDIGGPTLLRAAAKSRRIVLSVSEQRQQVLDWLSKDKPNKGEFLSALAARAEYEVTRYSLSLTKYLNGNDVSGFVSRINVKTKYGENPQQSEAGFYTDNRVNIDPLGLDQFIHVQGMERSYINMTDIDRLLQTITHIAAGFERNFSQVPSIAVGVKHGNACGAAVASSLTGAVEKMLESDTRAIFGGVVMVNGEIDKKLAETLMHHAMDSGSSRLLDGVVGAAVTKDALELLSRKKLRVIINPALGSLSEDSLEKGRRGRPVRGGTLEQPNYTFVQDLSANCIEQYGKSTDQQKRDMILAWAVGCTSNSNTITIVKNGQLIGNGVGQQDRVGAGQLAITRTTNTLPNIKDNGDNFVVSSKLDKTRLEGAVAYSDSFFPFADGPSLLARAGITAILTSSGSVADEKVITALKALGVSLIMVPDKVGRGFYAH
jgi:phosphoribosylaminoimidazolecarboxamide formyltransferase/IMP cyclohydrolase